MPEKIQKTIVKELERMKGLQVQDKTFAFIFGVIIWGTISGVGCVSGEQEDIVWIGESETDTGLEMDSDTDVYIDDGSDLDSDADTDADTDVDGDTDSDMDTDTDSDADWGVDTDTENEFDDDSESDSGSDITQPTTSPKLNRNHVGWKKPNCWASGCHSGFNTHNKGMKPGDCAKCHGRNGATRPHGIALSCGFCHENPNDHPAASFAKNDCMKCH